MKKAQSDIPPRIISVGTANPPKTYSQKDILNHFHIDSAKVRSIFENSHILKRHLYLPKPKGGMALENPEELIAKHLKGVLDMGRRSVEKCLKPRGVSPEELDLLVTVSTTGFLTPGISAFLIDKMGLRENAHRADLVGMGCNGGINGMMAVADFARLHQGKYALLLCCEVCSAAYVHDGTMRTGVVNSLFGDGSAAVLIKADPKLTAKDGPAILGFESHIILEALLAMRFDIQADGRLSFFLDRDIPYVIGDNVRRPIGRLLDRFNLKKRDITHWIVHSGGKKVVDSIKYNLGLTNHDVRHTKSILREYGNLSSGSFLFSFERLTGENIAREGDLGVMITMGPGTTIETGLLRW